MMLPGYFGLYTNLVTGSFPATSLITRQTLSWEPAHPGLFADLDNGHYFSGADGMTTFAPHRDTVEVLRRLHQRRRRQDTLARLLAENVGSRPVRR